MKRRSFLRTAGSVVVANCAARGAVPAAPHYGHPRITFYGATQQVSGSCHLLESSHGLYLVDCGRFVADVEDPERENRELPFDPKEVKAVLLTHAHADHHGRLPLLYKRGFRGKVYCTDATRDLTRLSFGGGPMVEDDQDPLFDTADINRMLEGLEAVPYNRKIQVGQLTARYTDAGHILGSAMIEVWVDGRKLLFGGDIGPGSSPILHSPAIHSVADAVLVESTYGPSPNSEIYYGEFGRQVSRVIDRGGDVLLPTFALHKSQILIFILQKLIQEGTVPASTPIYCDSGTVHKANLIYDAYREYHDREAEEFFNQHGSLFFMGKYREGRVDDFLKAHGGTPSIFIATSGMIAYAASPRHLLAMAGDPNSALLIPGYQAPGTVGRQLLDGQRNVTLNIQEFERGELRSRKVRVQVELEVERVSGFSSHASGEQILQWLGRFDTVGPVYVVHGDQRNATGMAGKLTEMGVEGIAPQRGESFTVKNDRVKPGKVPALERGQPLVPAVVDQ